MSCTPDSADTVLLDAIQQGNRQAFAYLVQRHTSTFYRLAYRFMNSRDDAEDIVQDAFLALWEHPYRFKAEKNVRFTTWFYRVIVNRCLDAKRKPESLELHEDSEDETENQETQLIASREHQQLEQAIAQLPERQRTALNLAFYEELSNKEAADVMNIPLKALQSLLMRAKTNVKLLLQEKKHG